MMGSSAPPAAEFNIQRPVVLRLEGTFVRNFFLQIIVGYFLRSNDRNIATVSILTAQSACVRCEALWEKQTPQR
jgi:hypothetical protein